MTLLGIFELVVQHIGNDKWLNISKIISILFQAFAILVFINTRQPYATSLVFMFFIIKCILLIKGSILNK